MVHGLDYARAAGNFTAADTGLQFEKFEVGSYHNSETMVFVVYPYFGNLEHSSETMLSVIYLNCGNLTVCCLNSNAGSRWMCTFRWLLQPVFEFRPGAIRGYSVD